MLELWLGLTAGLAGLSQYANLQLSRSSPVKGRRTLFQVLYHPKLAAGHAVLRGLRLLRQGRVQESLQASRLSLEHCPRYWPARNNEGLAMLANGQVEEALAAFLQVCHTGGALPLTNAARCYLKLGAH